jgi:electron transport complex protein RnfD
VSALALLAGFAYLLCRRVIRPHIPLSVIGTVALFSGVLWLVDPSRFIDPLFHLLTGGLLLGAVFMATDYVTSPMHPKGMIIFGVGIGLLTVLIRVFGSYPEGISFAILMMNAAVPLLNKYCKPTRYSREVSHG